MTRLAQLLSLLLVPLLLALQAPAQTTSPDNAQLAKPKPFVGEVHYSQTVSAPESMSWMEDAIASKIRVVFHADSLRIDRNEGLQAGTVLMHFDAAHALRLDHEAKTSELGSGISIDDIDEQLKDKMPRHFRAKFTAVEGDPGQLICGYKTHKFKVEESAFLPGTNSAFVWIADELTLPRRRYQFNFPSGTVTAPLPLSIPLTKGVIMKSVVTESGATVTTTVTKVRAVRVKDDAKSKPFLLPKATFAKPLNYEGPDFPPAAELAPTTDAPAAPIDITSLPKKIATASGIELVLVAPTTFSLGSAMDEPNRHDNEQLHEVTLTNPYYAATTEVTQAQWLAVMGAESPSNFKGPKLPVESITWDMAQEFCAKLSELEGRTFRLPTEAEWELAATAGERTDFAAMDRAKRKEWLIARAWMYFNADYETHAVGSLQPNAWGLWDTLGNVEEWCVDGYATYTEEPITNPAGVVSDTKTTRGNGWISGYEFCRPAARSAMDKGKSKSTIGFRVFADA